MKGVLDKSPDKIQPKPDIKHTAHMTALSSIPVSLRTLGVTMTMYIEERKDVRPPRISRFTVVCLSSK